MRNREAERKGSAGQREGASKVGKQKASKRQALWDEDVSGLIFQR